ncbi:RNA pseudouridine synthase [Alkalihalobacillus alcalophilus ATCC 27647 = CGMCC 1.3604]|uniref:Pseudouridine synthase n=1 Tax=Alkalihalobacillus alcalophilus ATCC 27647 = CGMCC 1.3604 TaxID=1218173 RepID=A0A094XJ58_ALKAL|nr:pseudouridine synthase [Alkalihalobacillus alcalophilus ATCC 27647 = CGMCC 1.3604]THG92167.1 RNA pseudouridine synthase [Alkalihalobacillus alcalophilus ATCC 27647 = CGMCC 1.3604]
MIRLDKLLANMGYGSRKDVKLLLKKGFVKINGSLVKDGAAKVEPSRDEVVIGDEVVTYKPNIYFMLNKPKGVISATEDDEHKTVIDLLSADEIRIYEPFPVGRLDKDTEGLLLITNDGNFSHSLMSPRKHVEKTYIAKIKGKVTEEDIEAFAKGVKLEDGYVTKPADLTILEAGSYSQISLTITEGKFHQVKRMFIAVGKEVVDLKRIKIGKLELDQTLKPGAYRELTGQEMEWLIER